MVRVKKKPSAAFDCSSRNNFYCIFSTRAEWYPLRFTDLKMHYMFVNDLSLILFCSYEIIFGFEKSTNKEIWILQPKESLIFWRARSHLAFAGGALAGWHVGKIWQRRHQLVRWALHSFGTLLPDRVDHSFSTRLLRFSCRKTYISWKRRCGALKSSHFQARTQLCRRTGIWTIPWCQVGKYMSTYKKQAISET